MSTRNYFVPASVARAAPERVSEPLTELAVRSARRGRVASHQLPLLASCNWKSGSEWATQVLEKEQAAADRKKEALLAAAGYDPDAYNYYGVLDSSYPDHELICSVARDQVDGELPLEKWDGVDWGTAEVGPDGLEFVVLDQDVMADVLQAVESGSAGVMLRPFNPKAWVREAEPIPLVSAAPPPKHTGVMVAFYPDEDVAQELSIEGGEPVEDIHLTLAYLGDTEERPIDYQSIQRAVARWARRMSPITGEIAGSGLFTAGETPVTYASVDCPALPQAREMLVRTLKSEGVYVAEDHGYTPHMTLAYDDVDVEVTNHPLQFDRAVVQYGDDTQIYDLGTRAVAAGGAGPDVVYAIVDEFDTSAVLDLIRVVPGPIAYRRVSGKWVKDQPMLVRLMGVDPPPVVAVAPEQLQAVLAQVDAYDKENPPKPDPKKPITAALPWDEKKHKRAAGGRFGTKTGGPAQAGRPQGGRNGAEGPIRDLKDSDVGLGPRTPHDETKIHQNWGPGSDHYKGTGGGGPGGGGGGGGGGGPLTGPEIRKEPWKTLDSHGRLNAGLSDEFWRKQPAGFHDWLRDFLNKEAKGQGGGKKDQKGKGSDDGRNEKGERKGAAGDNKRDVAKGGQRSKAQVDAQKKAASSGGKKSGAKNLAEYWSRVPPEYRKALHDFVDAAAAKANHVADAPRRKAQRTRGLAAADRKFDAEFAKEGLGEARRRESFDRQLAGQSNRLAQAGINAQAISRVMKTKIGEETRQRQNFERQRRLKAEQERVRRLKMRHAEADNDDRDAQDSESLTAAVTTMPPQLIEYWIHGEGAAKVGWGTDGSYTRAVKLLAEAGVPHHMVHGAAANLYHLATGTWPGPKHSGLTAASLMPAKLKKYWSAGEGAAKIRWGTGGDFDRCRRNLAKYLPAHMISGACANLHKLATGKWPGKGRSH